MEPCLGCKSENLDHHDPECYRYEPVNIVRFDASLALDKQRWTDSYVGQSTQALRNRVVAQSNGHGGTPH